MDGLDSLPRQGPKQVASGEKGVCSSSHPLVTEIMLETMKQGGNAVDAAVAGGLLQATIEPHMTNHGGSLVALYWDSSTRKAYQLTATGTIVPGLARFNPIPAKIQDRGACIPGYMPGMGELHKRFGTQTWGDLCQPALKAARDGYPMYSFQYGRLIETLPLRTYFPAGRDLLTPEGFVPAVGDLFKNPELAQTLTGLAEEGYEYFTQGQWAQEFVKEANSLGWPIKLEHMSAIPPRWQEPLSYPHRGNVVIQPSPPEQTGVFTRYALGVMKHLGLEGMGHYTESAQSLYYLAHLLRWVDWEMGLLQDPELFEVPMDQWSSDEYHSRVADILRGSRPKVDLSEHVRLKAGAAGLASVGMPNEEPRDADSCELSVVDPQGNWLQLLHTGQCGGIPGAVVGGVPMKGTVGLADMGASISGWFTGGGRQKCIIGSTIILRDGEPWMGIGTPGRPNVTMPQVLHSILDFGMDPYQASDAPRMYPLKNDYVLEMESRIPESVIRDLAAMGVQFSSFGTYFWRMGSFQISWRDRETGLLRSSADPRRVGMASGF